MLLGALILLAAIVAIPVTSRADTVASLLGNFTINQYCGLQVTADSVKVRYTVVFGQLPALRELHLADANGDGVTTQAERDAYVQGLAPGLASQLKIAVDGAPMPLRLTRWTSSLPTEQGGFSLRLDTDFEGSLPPGITTGTHALSFTNQNYPGRIGWHEIAIQAIRPIQVFDTNGFGTSLTGGLTEALRTLPAAGPLDERSVRLSFTRGDAPPGTHLLQPRPRALQAQVGTQAPGGGETAWLQRQTQRVIGLISAPNVEPQITLLALLIAFVLGAMHAFSPGHGKTIVGAYLIGSRGTPKHAAFLGLTVTVTHTLGVFALGFATLFASRFIVPERLLPILSLLSGLIVFGMGMILLAQRWRGARLALARPPQKSSGHHHGAPTPMAATAMGPIEDKALIAPLEPGPFSSHVAADHHHDQHGHHHYDHSFSDHGHRHDHAHAHELADSHEHYGSTNHSHGGRMHSHVPPAGTDITWRSLLALGISGGLIPCPSAMVLLLAAVALNKTAYGMLLVLAFSVGLAVTLTAVGLVFLYARNSFGRPSPTARWPHLLPLVSAAIITMVGVVLCIGALQSTRL